jgi:hypothetical protein
VHHESTPCPNACTLPLTFSNLVTTLALRHPVGSSGHGHGTTKTDCIMAFQAGENSKSKNPERTIELYESIILTNFEIWKKNDGKKHPQTSEEGQFNKAHFKIQIDTTFPSISSISTLIVNFQNSRTEEQPQIQEIR